MSSPNFKSRTMWTGDNLPIMRGLNSESVDLIYLDPPFNSNRTYSAPIGSEAAGAAFKDTWTLDDVDVAWHGEIAEQSPAVYAVIVPQSGGGSDHLDNLQLLCGACNSLKGDRDQAYLVAHLKTLN